MDSRTLSLVIFWKRLKLFTELNRSKGSHEVKSSAEGEFPFTGSNHRDVA
jgi:hypothetical protein